MSPRTLFSPYTRLFAVPGAAWFSLAGWVGRVIPRAVVPPVGGPLGTTCVECTGEGVVLVEPALASAAPPQPEVEPVASEAPAVVEPVQPEIDPEVAAFAAGFDDDKI